MFDSRRTLGRWMTSTTLAASLLLSGAPFALAGPGDVNSINNGPNVLDGTYYNTPGAATIFENTAGTGLTINANTTVTGLEVSNPGNPGGSLTGNGGWLHFNAPGQVVKIDGKVDVSAVMDGSGAYLGNGGRISVNAGYVYMGGTASVLAKGKNGGIVEMNVIAMTMDPGASIAAQGLNGAGGVVDVRAGEAVNIGRGAIIDTSGAFIGSYNTNVINIEGGLVNLDGVLIADGFGSGQNGGIVNIAATKGDVVIGADGKATANGSDGFSGHNPADGGEGGKVEVYGYRNVINNGVLSANGGNGGTNPAVESGPVVDMVDANGNPVLNGKGNILQQQASFGQNGGQGGNGGSVLVSYGVKGGEIINNGAIEVKGGNGGDGQIALSEANLGGPGAHVAIGGNGGNAGNGGYVEFVGGIGAKLPSQVTLDNVNVSGGSGGAGGDAKVLNDCGCATPGSKGACGAPGQLKYSVTDIPGKPPTPPLFPPYPKEYPRLGEGLPSGIGPVLSYNRSIFMARAPLPIIKKKPVPPPPEVVEAPPPPKPAPPPPQKKATVRGFW